MIKRYGFTGTRTGLNNNQIQQIKQILQTDLDNGFTLIVGHGDCVGADTDFHNICNGLAKIVIYPPEKDLLRSFCKSDDIRPVKDYLERNKDIVNECDVLIACPISQKEELRSGTWSTIRYARSINKPVLVLV